MLEQLNFSGKKRLPVVLQTEATECGLACVVMIASYHGHDVDLNGLRQRFPVSLKGAQLEALINMASQLDLGCRALRLELDALGNLQVPAILHWNLNHYVVLKKIHRDKFYIHDPICGLRILKIEEMSEHFTGVALELVPTNNFSKQVARKKMRLSQLWSRLVGFRRAIIQLLILSVVLQLLTLVAPFYLQLTIDEAVVKFDTQFLLILAVGFGGLMIMQVVTSLMRSWAILYYGHQMSFQMMANVFTHLIHLPTSYFEKRHIGDILSRVNSTAPIQTALTQSLVTAIIDGFMATITGVVIFIYSQLLGAIVLVSVILLMLTTLLFYPALRRTQEEMIVMGAKENTHEIESVKASTTIKNFCAQNQRLSIWRNLMADTINSNIGHEKQGIFMGTIQALITGLQTILVVYFGAKLILSADNTFTVGMLFAFMSYRQNFTDSINSLFNIFIEYRLLGLHLERIADIAQAEPEASTLMETNQYEDAFKGKIELKNVRFRYSEADPWVLNEVNLIIEPNDFIALVGPSGGGKTTLLKLMLGLYLPTEGEILIDDKPLTESNRMLWRKKIGVVMQDDQLLSGSIADNISFFDPKMDMDRVYMAAQQAQIHDEIMAMPMHYLSMVGDMGSALSGGQKQRVFLARAFYHHPAALFLDEGTANIDEQIEQRVVDIIEQLQLTRIIVTHRPGFIQRANRIITIIGGKSLENG